MHFRKMILLSVLAVAIVSSLAFAGSMAVGNGNPDLQNTSTLAVEDSTVGNVSDTSSTESDSLDSGMERTLGKDLSNFADVDLSDTSTYANDEVEVVLKDGASDEDRSSTISALGDGSAEVVSTVTVADSTVATVKLPENVTMAQALQTLSDDESVAYAQPNYTYSLIDDVSVKYVDADTGEVISYSDGSDQSTTVEATSDSSEGSLTTQDSSTKVMNSFQINGISGDINQNLHTVSVLLPYGTSLTSLVATFSLSNNATAFANGSMQISGTTANDFSSPVTYTVTASDGTTQDYTVTVTDVNVNDKYAQPGVDNWQWYLQKIGAYEAWNTQKANGSVKVAVLDTGITFNHCDFADATPDIIDTADAYDVTKKTNTAVDTAGHGTHVAGIIAASANNTGGIAGVSYDAQVVPIKIFPDGTGTTNTDYIVSGYQRAIATSGVRVINMSLGGGGFGEYDEIFQAAVKQANDAGIVSVCAAGNENTASATYPSDFEGCVSVTATDSNDAKASFSNYGEAKDIAAPGVNITSDYMDVEGYQSGHVMAIMSGTSMASPIVAGTAALVIAKNPNLTSEQVKNVLYNTATDLGDSGFDIYFGNGRVDEALAIKQDASIELTSDSSVVQQSATLQFSVTGDDVSNYDWSIIDTGGGATGAISKTGLLTGYKTGTLRVRATLKSDSTRYTEKNITVSGIKLAASPEVTPQTSTSLKISWSQPASATGYYIYRTTDASTEPQLIATISSGSTTSYVDTGLTCGSTLYYAVQPFGYMNGEQLTGMRSALVKALVRPASPQNVVATSSSATSVTVTWDPVESAQGYYVYRADESDSASGYVLLNGNVTTTSYTDTGLTEGGFYDYKVVAYVTVNYKDITSDDSAIAYGIPKGEGWVPRARAPLNFTEDVDAATTSSIKLTWTAESGASGYIITCDKANYTDASPLKVTSGETTSAILSSLAPNTTYSCTIRSYTTVDGVDNLSTDSATVNAVTAANAPTNMTVSNTANSDVLAFTWDTTSGDYKCRVSVEQKSSPYSEKDVIVYDGTWKEAAWAFDGTLNKINVTLSDSIAPTLKYCPSSFRVRLTSTISAIDRTGHAVDYSTEQSTVYSDYGNIAYGTGGLATPTIKNPSIADGVVSIPFTSDARCKTYTLYRATSSSGPFEAVSTISNPGYANKQGSSTACMATDTPGDTGTYYYKLVGTVTLGDGTVVTTADSNVVSAKLAGLSSENSITSFTLLGTKGVIDGTAHTITITLPYGTASSQISSIAPVMQISAGATVSPAISQTQDFTSPVTYTVTAENGATTTYTVTVTIPSNSWTQLAGGSRYKTMEKIVQTTFADKSCGTVILSTGENFPDALAASALAGIEKCPIILTSQSALSDEAKSEIERLGASDVLIIGGTSAVSSDTELAVKGLDGVKHVRRIFGSSRDTTAIDIYNNGEGNWSDTVLIVNGYGYADALSISPYAYASKSAIFLTQSDGTLSESTKQCILEADPKNVILIGGSGVVSDTVKTQLGTRSYQRLGGQNRYQTSALIAFWESGSWNASVQPIVALSYNNSAVATGSNFPDALVGGVFCGEKGSVLLLVDDSDAGRYNIDTTIYNNRSTIEQGYFFGGDSAVSPNLQQLIRDTCKS